VLPAKQVLAAVPSSCPNDRNAKERNSLLGIIFLVIRSAETPIFEGYGLQPVRKCLAMNLALAAEGRFRAPAPGGNSDFFRSLYSPAGLFIPSCTVIAKSEAHLDDEPIGALGAHALMETEDVLGESRSSRPT